MKKIIFVVLSFATILSFASCQNKADYTLDKSALYTEIATEWLNKEVVPYSSEACNEYKETASSHIRLFLPTDLNASLRLNVMNLENVISKRTDYFQVCYGSPSSLSSDTKAKICELLEESFTETNYLADVAIPTERAVDWDTNIKYDEDNFSAVDGQSRSLYVVYLPIYVEIYLRDSKDINHNTLQTYVIMPIAYDVAYQNGTELVNVDAKIQAVNIVTGLSTKGMLS